MEEKEKYKVYKDNRENSYICDTSKNVDYKIYQEFVDLLNQQDKRIKELEEELDDAKRDYIPKLEFGLQRANKMSRDAEEENQQLKQQLAEKDKEIERLNLEFETQEDWQEKWQKLYDETCNLNQDKISFAIEQLEKVKEKALHFYVNDTPKLTGFYVDVNEIENQINQLTHQHEDKGEHYV